MRALPTKAASHLRAEDRAKYAPVRCSHARKAGPIFADRVCVLEHDFGCNTAQPLHLLMKAPAMVHVARMGCLMDQDGKRFRPKRVLPEAGTEQTAFSPKALATISF